MNLNRECRIALPCIKRFTSTTVAFEFDASLASRFRSLYRVERPSLSLSHTLIINGGIPLPRSLPIFSVIV